MTVPATRSLWRVSLAVLLGAFPCSAQTSDQKPGSVARKGNGTVLRAANYLRSWNKGPVLVGLPQELNAASTPSRRLDSTWTGHEDGAVIILDIAVEGGISGEILIGFFEDPRWSKEPVQLRAFAKPGRYTVDRLMPGTYQIGAMMGSHLKPVALGVHETWPSPAEIDRDEKRTIGVLLSREFVKHVSELQNTEIHEVVE